MNEGESVNDFCWCLYMSASGASIISRPFALAYTLSGKFRRCGEVGDVGFIFHVIGIACNTN